MLTYSTARRRESMPAFSVYDSASLTSPRRHSWEEGVRSLRGATMARKRTRSVEVGENAAARDIPLSETQLRFLEPEKDAHNPEIFIINNQSKPWERRYLRDYIKKVYDELDIKGHQYKDLRHSFAIRCIQAGCDYGSLSRLLGVTQIERLYAAYQAYVKEDPRKYMEKAMGAISSFSR